MIKLKENFKRKGVEYTQLLKTNKTVVYKCKMQDDTYFEVFKLKTKQADIYHSDTYEAYPSDESFGSWAWCCSNAKSLLSVLNKHFQVEKEKIVTILGEKGIKIPE